MPAKPTVNVGSFCLKRIPYPPARWKVKGVKEYAPNWVVVMRLPGNVRPVKTSSYEICAACLAVADSPTKVRQDCRCQKPARDYGKTLLKAERDAWQEGRHVQLEGGRRHKSAVMMADVFALYEKHGPSNARRQTQRARQLLEQSTGQRFETMTVDVVRKDPLDLVLKWAAMRQVYAERGWSAKVGSDGGSGCTAPTDAWVRLRREWEAGDIRKVPDRAKVRAVNTTITGFLRDLKCIFSKVSRTNYLPGMKLPETMALREIALALPHRRGFVPIAADKYRAMFEAWDTLKDEDLQLWAALRLSSKVGPRTIEMKAIKPHWIEKRSGHADPAHNGDFLVLKNRPDEGFYLKAKFRSQVRAVRLPLDLVAVFEKIRVSSGDLVPTSVLGTVTDTEMEELVRRGSAWIRQFIPNGPHTWYWFRKLVGSLQYAKGSMKTAGAALGHAVGSRATADTYVEHLEPIEPPSDEELAAVAA